MRRDFSALCCVGALLLMAACGDDRDAETTDTPATAGAAPEAPPVPVGDPPGEPPPEETGLREWVVDMHRRALVAAGTGEITLSPESQANQRAQRSGLLPLRFSVATTYFVQQGSEEGQFTVVATFFRERTALRYTALRRVSGADSAYPAVDSIPVLQTWDGIIRRRIQQERCAFPLLDAAHSPPGFTLDEWGQRDLESFPSYCETAQAALAAGAQRSRRYAITWQAQTGGRGALSFDLAADGTPTWRSMDFFGN